MYIFDKIHFMKYLSCLLLLLICIGFKKEEPKPKIEIYLLNKIVKDVNIPSKKDLMPEPFINDDQIIGLNVERNKLVLDSVAAKKIINLIQNVTSGVQFVMTIDEEIVFGGHFWTNLSSYYPSFLVVFPPIDAELYDNYVWSDKVVFDIFYINKNQQNIYSKELIEAFRASGRLIEE